MGTLPQAKINNYYAQFKSVAVAFTKEVIAVTGLRPEMVNLKCASDLYPCVIYSTSFETAKIVANNRIIEKLQATNNAASLRFFFRLPATEEEFVLLIPARLSSSSPYTGSPDMSVFNLQFSQRPPDDFIEIVGRVLEANHYAATVRDVFVPIDPDAVRKMHFYTKEAQVVVDGVSYGGIPREFSFGAMRFVHKDAPQTILDKSAHILIHFDEPRETLMLDASVARYESAVGHPKLSVVTLSLSESLPIIYKIRLCGYITSLRNFPPKDGKKTTAQPQGGAPV